MGLEVAALMAIAGGVTAFQESKKQAKTAVKEADERANLRADEVRKQLARNTALFAKSGVSLEGSPLLSLEEGVETGVQDINAIQRQGQAQAEQLIGQGRAALLGSVGQAAQTGSKIPSGSGNAAFDSNNASVSRSTGLSTSQLAGAF